MSEKSFVSQHTTGWILAALTAVIGGITNGIYRSILEPTQAQVAAAQLEDSMSNWVLHQQTSYGDVIPNVVIGITGILVILFLLPTIKHAINLAKTDS